jgi:hypothetical protein
MARMYADSLYRIADAHKAWYRQDGWTLEQFRTWDAVMAEAEWQAQHAITCRYPYPNGTPCRNVAQPGSLDCADHAGLTLDLDEQTLEEALTLDFDEEVLAEQ